MENKKSGIRLRHLQQPPEEAGKRDLSPNNPNRKKIFDKNQKAKQNQRTPAAEERIKYAKNQEDSFNEYQQLVQNLKKKTMEVELRDETIKYLNKQIEELKTHIKHKDKEIHKLNQEISLLQKEKEASKPAPKENVFDSFKNPSQITPYSYEPAPINSHNQSLDVVQAKPSYQVTNARPKPAAYQERALQEEISLGNLNSYKNTFQQKNQEEEILSPFMALNNTRSFSHHPSKDPKKEIKTSRITNPNNTSQQQAHASTESWGFNKKKQNNDFDFSREEYMPKKSVLESVDKQLQKFNIFGEAPESKKEIFARNKLQIEDSRQFKFQEFEDKGYGDFASRAIY